MTLLPTKRPEGEASGSEATARILRLGQASGTWALPVIIPPGHHRSKAELRTAGLERAGAVGFHV